MLITTNGVTYALERDVDLKRLMEATSPSEVFRVLKRLRIVARTSVPLQKTGTE